MRSSPLACDQRIGSYDQPVDVELPESALDLEDLAAMRRNQPQAS